MIKRFEVKPQMECRINKDIQGLRKKRVAFSAKEVYEQVQNLNKKIPHWTNEN